LLESPNTSKKLPIKPTPLGFAVTPVLLKPISKFRFVKASSLNQQMF